MTAEWMADTPCATVDPETFFPPSGGLSVIVAREAKKVCGACRSQAACLTYALADHSLFGIWGGTTEKDREKLRGAA